MPPPAIETRTLTRSFGETPVLQGLDLQVETGTIFALLGPNGAGKTTLVRILATLIPPDGGTAHVLGHDVAHDRKRVRGVIGLTGQFASVDELLTGRENLVLVGRLLRTNLAHARSRAAELLERFDLTDAADRRVSTYSGGMRRRLDLAASLIASPEVIFLDEPTTGLDPRSRRALWSTIADLARDGTTILLTTQYLEEADRLADRVGVLDDGRLLVEGTAEELKRRVGQELLTLVIAPTGFERAAEVLAVPHVDRDRATSRLSLALDGAEHLRSILQLLHDERIDVHDVRVAAPTLDDVFLTLTDRERKEVAA